VGEQAAIVDAPVPVLRRLPRHRRWEAQTNRGQLPGFDENVRIVDEHNAFFHDDIPF